MHNKNSKSKAFTLAETLITLALIGIITVLTMYMLNSDKIRQRELLGRFHITFAKLDNLVGLTAQASRNYPNWRADAYSLANLSCTDDSGNNISNKSICLKKALLSASSIPQDCSEPDKCFKNYDKLTEQLKSIFPSFKSNDSIAFTLPGGVQVLGSYLDSTCELEIPIGRGRDNTVEKVKGCGFLLADVNGNSKPNNLLIGDDKIIDRFLMAITPNGLVKSNLLDEIAGCPSGTTYDATTKECVNDFNCPLDMDYMKELQNKNSEDLLILEYPYGAEHSDCYEVKCKSGDAPDSENKCPELCSASDEKRYGGLWLSEGGDLPDKWSEKACCVPISNQAELASINTDSNSLSRNYCLMADINFDKNGAGSTSTEGWTPIGNSSAPFKGSFYGNGHKISNFYINKTSSNTDYIGLFGVVSGGSLNSFENMEIDSGEIFAKIDNGGYIGSLIGELNNKAKNLVNSADITEEKSSYNGHTVGGIIGESNNDDITNIKNLGDITINDSLEYSSGNIWLGGNIGYSNTNITNLVNLGSTTIKISCLTTSGYAVASGGNLGTISNKRLKNSINSGKIDVEWRNKDPNTPMFQFFISGITPASLLLIENVINTGDVFFNHLEEVAGRGVTQVGGIVTTYAQDNETVSNSINTGEIRSTSRQHIQYILGATGTNSINIGGIEGNPFNADLLSRIITIPTTKNIYYIGLSGKNLINYGQLHAENTEEVGIFDTTGNAYNLANTSLLLGNTLASTFYLSGSVTGCTTAGDYTGCSEILASDIKKAATYSAISSDSANAQYWSIIDGFFPTLKASVMPPQIFRDCRNNKTPYGGCYDVLNTPNAFMPDFGTTNPIGVEDYKPFIMWAWKKPTTNTTPIEYPVLRWQCKPYRLNGYDCCRPSYATWEPKLPACPALVIPSGADYRSIN